MLFNSPQTEHISAIYFLNMGYTGESSLKWHLLKEAVCLTPDYLCCSEEDQRSDDGQSESGDEQYYKASYLVNEDEQLAKTLTQSLVFNSNPLWEVENIYSRFPFSFYSVDR